MRTRLIVLTPVLAVLVAVVAVGGAAWTVRAHYEKPTTEFCGEAGFGPASPPQPTARQALDVTLVADHIDTRAHLAAWRQIHDGSCGTTFCRPGVQEAYSADPMPGGGWTIQGVDLTGGLARSCNG